MSIARLFVQTVSVQPLTGEGSADHIYGPAQSMPCYVEEVSRLITNQDSEERTAGRQSSLQFSTTVIYAPLSASVAFVAGSKVTLPSGKVTRVQQCNVFQAPTRSGSRADHIEVHVI